MAPKRWPLAVVTSQSIKNFNMAYEFSDANFQNEVIGNEQLTVVDLWAEWCGPCKMMSPMVEELSTEYEGRAVIGKLNVDDNPEVPTQFNVRGIPTFLIFKNGELKEKIVGAQTKQFLKDKIEAHI
jgi:thioredoxin 1